MKVGIFTLLMLLLSSAATGYAQDTSGECGENLTWTFSEGTLTISGTGAMDNWDLAKDVPWASYQNSITAVVMEDGVSHIGASAFCMCVNLPSVTITESVTSIGMSAFYGCSGLTEIVIPDGVETIQPTTFGDCAGLASVTIGKGVKSIGAMAFAGCSNLTTVTNLNPVPQNISAAYLNVFGNLSTPGPDLSQATLYVASEEARAAYETAAVWKNFKEILCVPTPSGECGDNLTWVFSAGTLTISGTGAMYDWEQPNDLPWVDYLDDITTVVIEDGATSIGGSAFGQCVNLTSVSIPNSVTSIEFAAFGECFSLSDITIPNSVEYIGSNTFASCKSLTAITIPEKVTTIADGTFAGSGLTEITIPNQITSIGEMAFSNCMELTSVSIGSGVESIADGAFAMCLSLSAITIPDNVTNLGGLAFYFCGQLASVNIGSGVESIAVMAFAACSSLEEIVIPDNVESIGALAFAECDALVSVTIGKNVESIEDAAFAGCSALTTVTNLNPTPQEIVADVFGDDTSMFGIYYPAADLSQATLYVASEEAKAAYEAADVWKEFGEILYVPSSIDTRFAEGSIRIYPNPVVESFCIEGITAPTPVVVMDASGQTVMRQTVNGSENVSVGQLPQGIYFVQANGKVVKFIKK
jgi:hypothetical protein